MNDIPPALVRSFDDNSESHPTDVRYTLQYLDENPKYESAYIPNNSDAAFKSNHDTSLRPSAFLFHYRYGASALVKWGKGLDKRIPPSRPPEAITATVGQVVTTNPQLQDERKKNRDFKREEQGMQGTSHNNTAWTTEAVFETYHPLDVLRMVSPSYNPEIDEAFDQDVEVQECPQLPEGFTDNIAKWRNAVVQYLTN